MDLKTHNTRMVSRFLWLEQLDPDYARWALNQYRKDPNSPNPNILADVKAEKTRRALLSQPANQLPKSQP